MELCSETITVLNAKTNPLTRDAEYYPTVIEGVSWFERTVSSLTDTGLKAAGETLIRIPVDAEFFGKDYVDPANFDGADPSQTYTLDTHTLIVRGAVPGDRLTRHELNAVASKVITVLGVTDNRRARARHWKVTGK